MVGETKDDMRDGEWKWYHPNGTLETSVRYSNGKKQGEQTFFDDGGQIIRTEIYANGKLQEVRTPG